MVSELVKRAVALRLGVRKPKFSYAFCSKVVPVQQQRELLFYFNGISEGTLGTFRCMVSELVKRAVALRLGVRKPEFSYAFCSKVVPAATLAARPRNATEQFQQARRKQ